MFKPNDVVWTPNLFTGKPMRCNVESIPNKAQPSFNYFLIQLDGPGHGQLCVTNPHNVFDTKEKCTDACLIINTQTIYNLESSIKEDSLKLEKLKVAQETLKFEKEKLCSQKDQPSGTKTELLEYPKNA